MRRRLFKHASPSVPSPRRSLSSSLSHGSEVRSLKVRCLVSLVGIWIFLGYVMYCSFCPFVEDRVVDHFNLRERTMQVDAFKIEHQYVGSTKYNHRFLPESISRYDIQIKSYHPIYHPSRRHRGSKDEARITIAVV